MMEVRKWKPNGYLYRFATVYTNSNVKYGTDICTYTRAVLWGMFMWVLIMAAAGLCGAAIGDFGAWIVSSIVAGSVISPMLGAVFVLFIICVCVIVVCVAGVHHYFTSRDEPILPENVREMYSSFKQKTCFRIDFE